MSTGQLSRKALALRLGPSLRRPTSLRHLRRRFDFQFGLCFDCFSKEVLRSRPTPRVSVRDDASSSSGLMSRPGMGIDSSDCGGQTRSPRFQRDIPQVIVGSGTPAGRTVSSQITATAHCCLRHRKLSETASGPCDSKDFVAQFPPPHTITVLRFVVVGTFHKQQLVTRQALPLSRGRIPQAGPPPASPGAPLLPSFSPMGLAPT